jgi:hypothetical protein
MDLGNHVTAYALRMHDEQRLQWQLERRRLVAESVAEVAEAAEGVTDAARPRRGIRARLPRHLGWLEPQRPATL